MIDFNTYMNEPLPEYTECPKCGSYLLEKYIEPATPEDEAIPMVKCRNCSFDEDYFDFIDGRY